jgi:gas vesicle protein
VEELMERESTGYSGTGLAPLLAGLGLGALIAILLAPRSGEETRELIAETAREGKDVMLEAVEDLRDQVGTAVNGARKKFEGALETGREAYRREITQKHSEI